MYSPSRWLPALLALSLTTSIHAAPPMPPQLTLTVSGSQVTAAWDAPEGAEGYTLFYAPYPGADYIGELAMGGERSVSVELPAGSAFYVAVKAFNADGASGYSNIDSFTIERAVAGALPTSAVVFDEQDEARYRNSGNDASNAAFDTNRRGYLQLSSCGEGGLILLDSVGASAYAGGRDYTLLYYDINRAARESVTALPNGRINGSLLFDAECNPQIYRTDGDGYQVWRRSGGAWVAEALALDLAAALGGFPSRLSHYTARRTPDGTLHLVMGTHVQGSERVVHAANDGTGWRIESAGAVDPEAWELFQLTVCDGGAVHAVYNRDRHLYYARMGGGDWSREVVIMRPNFDTDASRSASIDVKPDGTPAIASTYATRAMTGSFTAMELRYSVRGAGGWSSATVVSQADGYAGGDGTQYTGDNPHLLFDGQGRPHIAFNDLASWHNANGWNETASGQIRYARNLGGGWELSTPYAQLGQSASPNPLIDLLHPTLALSSDGSTRLFAGVERTTSGTSLIYDLEVPIDYRGIVLSNP